MRELYQNQAASAMVFFASAGEHIAGVAGINSVTASASKDGAAFALITATASAERGRGWYNFTLNSGWTDTLGELAFTVSAASADPVDFKYWVTYPKFGASAALASAVSAVHATATYFPLLVSAVHSTATLISDPTFIGGQGMTATYVKASATPLLTHYTPHADSVITAGTEGGAEANITAINGSVWSSTDAGAGIQFDLRWKGGGTQLAQSDHVIGVIIHVGSLDVSATVKAYNWVTTAYELIGTLTADTAQRTYFFPIGPDYHTAAATGVCVNIYIDGVSPSPGNVVAIDYVAVVTQPAESIKIPTLFNASVQGVSSIQSGLSTTVALSAVTATLLSDPTFIGAQGITAVYTKASGAATELGVGNIDVALSSRMAATATVSAQFATAHYISDSTYLGGQGLTAVYAKASGSWTEASGAYKELTTGTYKLSTLATSAAVQTVSATATNILDHLAGTYTVDPTTSGASAYRMDGATLLKAWTLSAATYASAVPAFIKRTV